LITPFFGDTGNALRRSLFAALILTAGLAFLHAEEPASIESFESLLEDVSDIATRKSLNTDYLPAVVTVIDAETFRAAGIQNLSEALDMLPGF